jgi:hypothetical protein
MMRDRNAAEERRHPLPSAITQENHPRQEKPQATYIPIITRAVRGIN